MVQYMYEYYCVVALLILSAVDIGYLHPSTARPVLISTPKTMTRIAQIEDHGSVLAWSPIKKYADVVALGTKVSRAYCAGGLSIDFHCSPV